MAAPLRPGTGLESSEMEPLRPFQRRFLASALSPGVDTSALSLSRGNGKSYLAAHVLTRCLSPGDVLHVPGSEYLLCAGSVEQARLCFRFVRAELEPTGAYRWLDSLSRIAATDKRDGTRLRVMSSNGKTAMGIVGCPLLVADEPGAWEATGGTLMHDAIQTAQGKPGFRGSRSSISGRLRRLATVGDRRWSRTGRMAARTSRRCRRTPRSGTNGTRSGASTR